MENVTATHNPGRNKVQNVAVSTVLKKMASQSDYHATSVHRRSWLKLTLQYIFYYCNWVQICVKSVLKDQTERGHCFSSKKTNKAKVFQVSLKHI